MEKWFAIELNIAVFISKETENGEEDKTVNSKK